MITITEVVDIKAQTITWHCEATPPEHDIDGVMCHAMEEAVFSRAIRRQLNLLGYAFVAARSEHPWSALILYWARPE